MRILKNARIINYKRINNSSNGNPRYFVILSNDDESIEGNTQSDSACGYSLTNYIGKEVSAAYHYTDKGNIIIDSLV